MEIIEKEVIKDHKKDCASKGMAGTALGLGIAGTTLALMNNGGFGLFGNSCGKKNDCYLTCDDKVDLASAMYKDRITELQERFDDRQVIDKELFGLYKSQTDADFGLYKSLRDGFDVLNAKHNKDAFDLYKGQRDNFDVLSKRINDLETQVAVNSAVRPYLDKLIQCEIDKAYNSSINYTDRKTCRMISGQVVIPTEPLVTGVGSFNPCCNGTPVVEK